MKKYIFLFFVFFFVGCSKSSVNGNIKEYNDSLIVLQAQSVDVVKNYYEGLEKNYDGSNLLELFTGVVNDLQNLEQRAQNISSWNDDNELKDAVVNYISGLQIAFMSYERPVVAMLLDYTGQVSHFYRDNESFFSSSAMKLAGELAVLDRELEGYYIHFSEKYRYNE